jgi:hypothetical protein
LIKALAACKEEYGDLPVSITLDLPSDLLKDESNTIYSICPDRNLYFRKEDFEDRASECAVSDFQY